MRAQPLREAAEVREIVQVGRQRRRWLEQGQLQHGERGISGGAEGRVYDTALLWHAHACGVRPGSPGAYRQVLADRAGVSVLGADRFRGRSRLVGAALVDLGSTLCSVIRILGRLPPAV